MQPLPPEDATPARLRVAGQFGGIGGIVQARPIACSMIGSTTLLDMTMSRPSLRYGTAPGVWLRDSGDLESANLRVLSEG